ncbi:exopolysaccharide production repressor protein [Phyllobacterium sp. SB3]|uniref:exopolysaccharide production repressor protein n=1 Tax=Phyllobacterium sp. SB3 TaxID=3156073 RepID=UPI0032AECDF8
MKLPRFLIGFIAVLLLFGTVTYVFSQNLWTTFVQTLICAFVIQIGYFLIVLAMVKVRQRQYSSQPNVEEENGSGKSQPALHAPRLKHTR